MSPRLGLDLKTILQAAIEIADAEGIEAITLATLAKKLNIRPPSLYNHIDGLAGLRKQLTMYGIEELKNCLSLAAVGRSGDDAIREMGEAYIAFARKNPGLYEATFLSLDTEDIQDASSEAVQVVVRVLDYYGLNEEDAIHATRGLRSILHGFASIEQKGGFAMGLDINKSFHFLINTYIYGLKKLSSSK